MKKYLLALILLLVSCVHVTPESPKLAEQPVADKPYQVIMFGDLHYDNMDCHSDENKVKRKGEFSRNARHWGNLAPKIINAAASKITPDTAFAFQAGDITQGDGKTTEAAKQLFTEAIEKITTPFTSQKVPFYIAKGNHDFRSPGGRKAFAEAVVPFLKTQLPPGAPIVHSNYFVEKGPDLYLFIDCQLPDFDFAKKAIDAHPGIRHLFVIEHLPVIPWPGGNPGWCLFGINKTNEQRIAFRKLIAKHNAIILAGHVHSNSLTEYQSDEGRISQITISSMGLDKKRTEFPKPGGTYHNGTVKGVMEGNPEIEEFMNEYIPHITKFEKFGDGGFGILKVDGAKVMFELYRGFNAEKPGFVWSLR